jgi:pyridoxamine 5'-phosphate oxidase
LGAVPGSTPRPSRHELEEAAAKVAEKFPGTIPLPDFWGGFRVVPDTIEFWQGGPGRLHDRLLFSRVNDGWTVQRLAP